MKKVNKILLGSVLPFLGLSVTVPVIATSCSVTPATITKTQWNSYFDFQPGFSLNSTKDELIFDASIDSSAATPTLDAINQELFNKTNENFDKWEAKAIITDAIVNFNGWKIQLESKPQEDPNSKITIYSFLLSKNGDAELSRLKLIVKNYLIEGTWSTKELDSNAKISNDGKDLSVDLTDTNAKWLTLTNASTKQNVKDLVVKQSGGQLKASTLLKSSELSDVIKNVIDKKDGVYDSYNVTIAEEGNKITFNIVLAKSSNASITVNMKLIVTNNKTNWT